MWNRIKEWTRVPARPGAQPQVAPGPVLRRFKGGDGQLAIPAGMVHAPRFDLYSDGGSRLLIAFTDEGERRVGLKNDGRCPLHMPGAYIRDVEPGQHDVILSPEGDDASRLILDLSQLGVSA